MKNTKTSFFLTPVVELKAPTSIYTSSYVGTYLGDYQFDSTSIGEHMFFIYDNEVDPKLHEHFISHPSFKTTYVPTEGKVGYVFKIDEEKQETVVKPFLKGKYSEVDRDYVEKNFPLSNPRLSVNRRVFDKDELLRIKWETMIGQELPPDAEVWSRPKLNEEVYRYPVVDDPDISPVVSH